MFEYLLSVDTACCLYRRKKVFFVPYVPGAAVYSNAEYKGFAVLVLITEDHAACRQADIFDHSRMQKCLKLKSHGFYGGDGQKKRRFP